MRQRENMKSTLQKYVTIVFGVVLVAFAISVFYTPNKIVSGGVSGVSTIFYHMLGVQPGLSFAVINILLLALFPISPIITRQSFIWLLSWGAVGVGDRGEWERTHILPEFWCPGRVDAEELHRLSTWPWVGIWLC